MGSPIATRGERIVLEVDDAFLEIDPGAGARITAFRLAGVNVLTGPEVDARNWGSTIWTSPQSDWGWPPPPEFDESAYALGEDEDAITLSGPPNAALGVALVKRFSVDRTRRCFVVECGLRNVGERPRAFAPWQVSRVAPRGLTFFPTGAAAGGSLVVQRTGGATWYEHAPEGLGGEGAKICADGTGGFVAHRAGRTLFVKTFADLPPEAQAPGEGEVEIYANDRYVEVEVQGPYASVDPGATSFWPVRWALRALPPHLMRAAAGDEELLAFAVGVAGDITAAVT
jgi:hypothetical protein